MISKSLCIKRVTKCFSEYMRWHRESCASSESHVLLHHYANHRCLVYVWVSYNLQIIPIKFSVPRSFYYKVCLPQNSLEFFQECISNQTSFVLDSTGDMLPKSWRITIERSVGKSLSHSSRFQTRPGRIPWILDEHLTWGQRERLSLLTLTKRVSPRSISRHMLLSYRVPSLLDLVPMFFYSPPIYLVKNCEADWAHYTVWV